MGLELKQYLTSCDVLHQLMFSTVLLHWFMYRDGPNYPKKDVDYNTWKNLNSGIETQGSNVPEHIQQQVYTLVSKAFIPELAVATPRPPAQQGEGGPDAGGGPGDEAAAEKPVAPLLASFAAAEGWAQIVGGGFPKPSGKAGVQMVTYTHVSSIFSEVTYGNSGLMRGPLVAGNSAVGEPKRASLTSGADVIPGTGSLQLKRDDFAWLSIVHMLLFFTANPNSGAPYAFIELRKVCISSIDEGAQILILVGAPEDTEAEFSASGGGAPARSPQANATPVGIVLLLPDGRWQELSLPKLELRFPSAQGLAMWQNHIMAGSQGKLQHQKFAPGPVDNAQKIKEVKLA